MNTLMALAARSKDPSAMHLASAEIKITGAIEQLRQAQIHGDQWSMDYADDLDKILRRVSERRRKATGAAP